MELFKQHTAQVVSHVFQSLLVAYLVLLLIEQIWVSSVSTYLNLNYLLVLVIIAGIFDVLSSHPEPERKDATKKDYAYIFLLGIAGFVIIKFKTSQLDWLSWLISSIAGILIILLSILVLNDKD